MSFDIQAIKHQVRDRRRELEDRRSPLVAESHILETRTAEDKAAIAKLTIAVGTVVGAGGDASSLTAQIAEIKSRLDPDTNRLAAVNREWALLNEVCKWIEMADDGLHWLIFSQSALDRHDQVGVWAPDYHLRKGSAMTDTNNTDGAALLPVTHPIDMLREMLALEIERTSGAESFMIRSGLLADLLDELARHRLATQEDAERSGVGSVENLRSALRPFARAWQYWSDLKRLKPDADGVEEGPKGFVIWSEFKAAYEALSTPQRQEYDGEAVREALLIEARDLFRFYEASHRAKVVGFQEAYDRATDVEDRDDALSKKMDTIDKAERNKAIADKIDAALAHPAQATPSAVSGDAGEGRFQKYLADETNARARLATFPDTVRQRLINWQEGQSEWFSDTLLEIVAEFIAFDDASRAGEAENKAGGLWYRRWHAAQTRVNELEALIANPPKHKFWGAGEPDCPREIKAPNGELHTLRCKACDMDNPSDDICRAALPSHKGAGE